MVRREYGSGGVYRRSDGRWIGTIEAGWTAKGTRRRITVSGKSEAEAKRKLRDKKLQIERDGLPAAGGRITVKKWSEVYLPMKRTTLRPKAYNAVASAISKWIVPTIGHRRLDELTPADLRAVADAHRKAGMKAATAAATHRALVAMLRSAIVEGHQVPQRVLLVEAPRPAPSDRKDIPLTDALALLEVAATLDHGSRWLLALLHGMRQGECLGLTEDALDFTARRMTIEWQLQPLPYNRPRDPSSGFRIPDDFEARHLVDAYHLVRPKSRKGLRTFPMVDPVAVALAGWLEKRPNNPWGLVFPTTAGRPANNKHDLTEWHAIQGTAGVGHPAGRYYTVHEARNVAATMFDEAGASEQVVMSMLGHASYATSRGYMTAHEEPKRAVLETVAGRLLPGGWG